MRVKDYPGVRDWPPQPGGAYASGEPFPTDVRSVTIAEVFPVVNGFLTFTCDFNGRRHSYDLWMKDKDTAEAPSLWLKKLVGKTLDRFGEFRLDV